MKNILISIILFLGVIFLSGCGQKKESNFNQFNQIVQNNPVRNTQSINANNEFSAYKNQQYNFTIQYPNTWQVDEDKSLAGPGFRPSNLSMQDIQNGKYDKEKDCFFSIALLSISKDKNISCKNNLGETVIGQKKFVKCNLGGIKYMLLHPKSNNIISLEYLNNDSCKTIFEKSLETLTFN